MPVRRNPDWPRGFPIKHDVGHRMFTVRVPSRASRGYKMFAYTSRPQDVLVRCFLHNCQVGDSIEVWQNKSFVGPKKIYSGIIEKRFW
jgi:hypothetical protein